MIQLRRLEGHSFVTANGSHSHHIASVVLEGVLLKSCHKMLPFMVRRNS